MTIDANELNDLIQQLKSLNTSYESFTETLGHRREAGDEDFSLSLDVGDYTISYLVRTPEQNSGTVPGNFLYFFVNSVVQVIQRGKVKKVVEILESLQTEIEPPPAGYRVANDDLVAKLKAMIQSLNVNTSIE